MDTTTLIYQQLDRELNHYDTLYARYQEIEAIVHAEMTDLERRMKQLATRKQRLQRAATTYNAETNHRVLYTKPTRSASQNDSDLCQQPLLADDDSALNNPNTHAARVQV